MNNYEAIKYIQQWIGWLIPLVSVGASARVGYLAFQKVISPEESDTYNKKIKTTIKAAVILVSIPAFVIFIQRYY